MPIEPVTDTGFDPLNLARAATLITCVAVPALIWARLRERPLAVGLLKGLASAGFLAAGLLLAPAAPAAGAFAWPVRAGLLLSFLGDLALVGRARRWVLMGLAAFLLAHLCYAAAVAPLAAEAPLRAGLVTLLGAAAGVAAGTWIVPHAGDLRRPVTAYLVVVSLSGTALLAAGAASPSAPGRLLLAGAGALLWISDLAVARQRLMVDSPWNRVWGLPTYYAGQLLLVWSLPMVSPLPA